MGLQAAVNDAETVAALCERHTRLAHRFGGKLAAARPDEADEMLSLAFEALFLAARTWEPGKGAFSTWFCWKLRGQAERYFRSKRRRRQVNFAALDDDPGEPYFDPSRDDREAETRDARIEALTALSRVDGRGAEVVRRHYLGGEALKDIAADMGVSRQAVQQARDKAIERIRARANWADKPRITMDHDDESHDHDHATNGVAAEPANRVAAIEATSGACPDCGRPYGKIRRCFACKPTRPPERKVAPVAAEVAAPVAPRSALAAEIRAMVAAAEALDALDDATRRRVLAYLVEAAG